MATTIDTGLRDRTFSRLQGSISGKPCDHHAVFFYYTYPFFHTLSGVDLHAYFHDPKVMFDTQLEVLERLGRCGSFAPDEGAVAEGSALGGTVRFDDHGFISIKEAPWDDLEDAAGLLPGDPLGDNYMRLALESLEYMLSHAPQGIKVNPPCFIGPFTMAAQVRGISDFCMDIIEEPELAKELLHTCALTAIAYIKEAQKIFGKPLHHILLADDISSFLSRPQYQEFVMPGYQTIFREFPDVQKWLHNDAGAGHIMQDIAATGWDAWQYSPDIDPVKALEDTAGKVSLLGGLDPVALQSMSAEETYAHCMERLAHFGGNTKCVLGPGGSANQIPMENIMMILKAADDFGVRR